MVALVGVLFSTLVVVRVMAQNGWDVSIFVAFGKEATATRLYAEERLDRIYLRDALGHDGKFFFVQSNDPWILDPEENAAVLDRPRYRSQRMLYPVLAGGAGLFGPKVIVWSMLVVNLIAMGVGTWVVSQIAMELGGSAWWGLAFGLNLGFVSELDIGGAGVVAAAIAFGAVLAMMRQRYWMGVVLLALAALTREAMLVTAAGVALWLWAHRERRPAVLAALAPVLAAGSWALYVRMRIGEVVVAQVEEIGWPFVGFVQAFDHWMSRPVDLVAGIAIFLLFVVYVRRVIKHPHLVGWAFVGFVLIGVLFTEQVWHSFFDITRGIAPVITSFVLLVFVVSNRAPVRTGVR